MTLDELQKRTANGTGFRGDRLKCSALPLDGKRFYLSYKVAALTLTSWNQLIADLTSIQAVMEHVEEKPSGEMVLAVS